VSTTNKKLAEPSLTSSTSSWTGDASEGNGREFAAEAKTRRYCCAPFRLAVVGVLLAELLLIVQQVCYNCFQKPPIFRRYSHISLSYERKMAKFK
jgi:hypothetical protein